MLTIFVLFVGLTLATAVIAYWSDNLGKKLGKKRVSLWGMRPRTTATILTIASSWLIMIFTLCVMLVIFPPLRRSLLRYDEVKAQEQGLRKSTTRLSGQLVELQGQTRSLKSQVENASTSLTDARAKLEASRVATTKARGAREAAQNEATRARQSARAATARQSAAVARETAARENLQKVSAQLGATQKQRAAAQQQLKVAQSDLDDANAEVQGARARVRAAEQRVKIASDNVAQAEKQLASVQSALARVQTDLTRAQRNEKTAQASAKLAEIRADNAIQKRKTADKDALESYGKSIEAQRKVDELEAQSKKLEEENRTLLADNQNIADVAGDLLSGNVRVPFGTILAAHNFPQGTSFTQAKQTLNALFSRVEEIVRGSDKVPPLLPDAQLILSPRLVPAPGFDGGDTGKFISVEGEAIYESLADAISHSQSPLSVRIVSERNHLLSDKELSVRFIVVPIRPALPDEFLLASARLNGQSGEAQIFSDLSKLVELGRQVATQQGVTPPLWRDSPNFYASGSNEDLFQALRKISVINGPARVSILTTQPISTADQLRVRFEVEPVNAVSTQASARVAPSKP